MDAGLPVLVDATLQLGLGRRDLIGMRRRLVVVVGVRRDTIQMSRVSLLAPLRQQTEVLQDVILRMGTDP